MSKKFRNYFCALILFISLFWVNQQAIASDILWNPGVGNDLSNKPTNLVPGAAIRNTGILVYKSNPDELIMKVIMNDSFEDKPFTAKGRNMAMWIYWPEDYCWSKEKKNCDGLLTVEAPSNPLSYPSQKSNQFVYVEKHKKVSNVEVTKTECKANWWIDSTYKRLDTWSFSISITCLGIPKTFGWYAYSEIDLGQEEVATDFTQVQSITYPFHDLASKAFRDKSNKSNEVNRVSCVVARTEAGYDEKIEFDEQCVNSNNWELVYCAVHPKAELQVYKSGKWRKSREFFGKKGNCEDNESPYEFVISGSNSGKHRIKNFGNNEYKVSFLSLKKSTFVS